LHLDLKDLLMFFKILDTVKNQNKLYDQLAKTNPTHRFLIFLFPLLVSVHIDIILFLTGKESTAWVLYFTLIIMALWRIPYMTKR